MESGEAVSNSSLPIGRALLVAIALAMMTLGTFKSMKILLAIMLTFLAIGRSGEVACACWSILVWNYEKRCFMLIWNEMKTGDHDQLPFLADR